MTNGKQKVKKSEEARNVTGTQSADLEVPHVTKTGHRLFSELSSAQNPIPCGFGVHKSPINQL